MNLARLGSTIKKLRNELSLTQEELATKIGVTWEMVSRYERGLSSPLLRLDRIAKALQTDTANLIAQAYSLTLHENSNTSTIGFISYSDLKSLQRAEFKDNPLSKIQSLQDLKSLLPDVKKYNAPNWIIELDQEAVLIEISPRMSYFVSPNIKPKPEDKVVISTGKRLKVAAAKDHATNLGLILASQTKYFDN